MATMNKPVAGDPNWYQAVTDNWTSIENNLVDKSIVTAKGDLIAASAAAVPARLAAGANGLFLAADSAESTGVKWMDATTIEPQTVTDVLWGKKFFSDNGFLPATKIFEHLGTPPVFDGTAGSATWTRDPGAMKPNNSGIGWYDLGAAKSKILLVVGNVWRLGSSNGFNLHLTPSAPTGLDPDGYSFRIYFSWYQILKCVSATYTSLADSAGYSSADLMCGMALYYSDPEDAIRAFLRVGGQWWQVAWARTNAVAYGTLRYVAFQAAAANQRFATPFVCYAQ